MSVNIAGLEEEEDEQDVSDEEFIAKIQLKPQPRKTSSASSNDLVRPRLPPKITGRTSLRGRGRGASKAFERRKNVPQGNKVRSSTWAPLGMKSGRGRGRPPLSLASIKAKALARKPVVSSAKKKITKDEDNYSSESDGVDDFDFNDDVRVAFNDSSSPLRGRPDTLDFDLLDEDVSFSSEPARFSSRSPNRIPWLDENAEYPELVLPKSSEDLLISSAKLSSVLEIYEVLRRFWMILKLSVFRLEDFAAALRSNECCSLISEIHMSLLNALMRDDENNKTTISRLEDRSFEFSWLAFMDEVTWPELLRLYLHSYDVWSNHPALQVAANLKYPDTEDVEDKISVLRFLCDLFLETDMARRYMLEGSVHEEFCRKCGKRGKLICCDFCTATYHLWCATPQLAEVPESEWSCETCQLQKLEGVTDSREMKETNFACMREDHFGYDRHGRRYRMISRRIFVEDQSGSVVAYYSSPWQFKLLLSSLDDENLEKELCRSLNSKAAEILAKMSQTMELAEEGKGGRFVASYLATEDASARSQLREAELRRLREKARLEEEARAAAELRAQAAAAELACRANLFDNLAAMQSAEGSPVTTPSLREAHASGDERIVDEAVGITSTGAADMETAMHHETPRDVSEPPRMIKINREAVRAMMEQRGSGVLDARSLLATAMAVNSSAAAESGVDGSAMKRISMRSDSGSPSLVGQLKPAVVNLTKLDLTHSAELAQYVKKLEAPSVDSSGESGGRMSKQGQMAGIPRLPPTKIPFKLGMEGRFRTYVNHMRLNPMASSVLERKQEKARYRALKFEFAGHAEFKWPGEKFVDLSASAIAKVLRFWLLEMLNRIPPVFFHADWKRSVSTSWRRAVANSVIPASFAAALATMEAFLCPVVFTQFYKHGLGDIALFRETAAEKEVRRSNEQLKKEELVNRHKILTIDPDDAEDDSNIVWVKYPYGTPRHQIWKFNADQQYRVNGLNACGGWIWISACRSERVANAAAFMQHRTVPVVGFQVKQIWRSKYADYIDELLAELTYSADLLAELTTSSSFQSVDADALPPLDDVKLDCETLPLYFSIDAGTFVPHKQLSIKVLLLAQHIGVINVSLGIRRHSVFTKKSMRYGPIDRLLGWRESAAHNDDAAGVVAVHHLKLRHDQIATANSCYSPLCRAAKDRRCDCYAGSCRSSRKLRVLFASPLDFSAYTFKLQRPHNEPGPAKPQSISPAVHRFKPERSKHALVQSRRLSLLVLPRWQVRKLARRAGNLEQLYGYSDTAKPNNFAWPYPCARPTFETCWRFRCLQTNSFAGIALLMRQLYASIRWNDLALEKGQSNSFKFIVHGETALEQRELIDHTVEPPFGLRFKFLLRTVNVPYETEEEVFEEEEEEISQRGRKRKVKVPRMVTTNEPTFTEQWCNDDEVSLAEVRTYLERMELEKTQAAARSQRIDLLSQYHRNEHPCAGVPCPVPVRVAESGSPVALSRTDYRPSPAVVDQYRRPPSSIGGSSGRLPAGGLRDHIGDRAGGKFTLTPTVIQEVIREGLLTADDADIKGKLMGLQQNYAERAQFRSPVGRPPANKTPTTAGRRAAAGGSERAAANSNVKRAGSDDTNLHYYSAMYGGLMPSGLDKEQREEFKRMRECVTVLERVMESVLKRHDMEKLREKMEARSAYNRQQLEARTVFNPSEDATFDHDDYVANDDDAPPTQLDVAQRRASGKMCDLAGRLKREILKRRFILIQEIRSEVRDELNDLLSDTKKSFTRPESIMRMYTSSPAFARPQSFMRSYAASPADEPFITKRKRVYQKQQPPPAFIMRESEEGYSDEDNENEGAPDFVPAENRRPPETETFEFSAVGSGADMPVIAEVVEVPQESAAKPVKKVSAKPSPLYSQYLRPPPQAAAPPVKPQATPARLQSPPRLASPPRSPENLKPNVIERASTSSADLDRVIRHVVDRSESKEAAYRRSSMAGLPPSKAMARKDEKGHHSAPSKKRRSEGSHVGAEGPTRKKPTFAKHVEKAAPIKAARKSAEANVQSSMSKRARNVSADSSSSSSSASSEPEILQPKRPSFKSPAKKSPAVRAAASSSSARQQKKAPAAESDDDDDLPLQIAARSEVKREGGMSPGSIKTSIDDPVMADQLMKSARKARQCICQTPYDPKKFYIGCTICSNWFHGSCVGVSEKQTRKLQDWVCESCKNQSTQVKEELYCICRMPYDESRFYVACDLCQNWFHGSCVNISEEGAEQVSYVCDACAESPLGRANQKLLSASELADVGKLLKALQAHKMAWPFLEPVDAKEVPDYYYWVKEPMDLHTMETKLKENRYVTLQDFIVDCTKIFDNCRYFNQKESVVSQCAEVLEVFFTERVGELREKLAKQL